MAGRNLPSGVLCRRLYQQYFNTFHPQRWFASVPRRAKVVAAAGRGKKAGEGPEGNKGGQTGSKTASTEWERLGAAKELGGNWQEGAGPQEIGRGG